MKKVKWIVLAVVLMLGLIGAAYAAAWVDEITIDGRVETGDINVKYRDLAEGPHFAYHLGDTLEEPFDVEPYGVDTNIFIRDNKKELVFRVENAFPGLSVGQHYYVENQGTAPVKLDKVELTSPQGEAEIGEGMWQIGNNEVNVHVADDNPGLEEAMIPAGEEIKLGVNSHTLSGAGQNETFNFTITMEWVLCVPEDE